MESALPCHKTTPLGSVGRAGESFHQTPRRAVLTNGTRPAPSFRTVALIRRFFTPKCRWWCLEDQRLALVAKTTASPTPWRKTHGWRRQGAQVRGGLGIPQKGRDPVRSPPAPHQGFVWPPRVPPSAAGGALEDMTRLWDTSSRPRFHPSKTFLTGGKRSACLCWNFLSRRAESKTGGIRTKKKKK